MPRRETGRQGALTGAAAAGDGARLRALLAGGATPDAADASGFTALDWAARNGRSESIRILVAAGAHPDARDSGPNGWTPLQHAVHRRQEAAVRALLAAGANPDVPGRNGGLPLLEAAVRGDLPAVEMLLAAGADPLVRNGGRTAVTNALLGGNPAVVRALRRRAPALRLRDSLSDRVAVWVAHLTGHGAAVAALSVDAAPAGQ